MDRLLLKHKSAAKFVPEPVILRRSDAQFGVHHCGRLRPAVREALDLLAERGIVADFMRVRGFPFSAGVEAFLEEHDFCFVIEQNRDAQLRSLLTTRNRSAERKAAIHSRLWRISVERQACHQRDIELA